MFEIRRRTKLPAEERLLRLAHLDDQQLADLIADTRRIVGDCDDGIHDHLVSCLAWMELEFAARGLEASSMHEQGFGMVLIPKLLRATHAGDEREIGRLTGAMLPSDLIDAFDLASREGDPHCRLLALSALCVSLEARLSSWESAQEFADTYLDLTLPVDVRLCRIERRWGFLLGWMAGRADSDS